MLRLVEVAPYRPIAFTGDDLTAYTKTQQAIAAQTELEPALEAIRTDLRAIIGEIIDRLEIHESKDTPIFNDSHDQFPLQRCLTELKAQRDTLTATKLIEIMQFRIRQYTSNELFYGADIDAQIKFGPIVRKANHVGFALEAEFASVLTRIEAIKQRSSVIETQLHSKKKSVERALPHVKIFNNLDTAFTTALTSLRDQARKENVLGIGSLCDEALSGRIKHIPGGPEEKIAHAMLGFKTLETPNSAQRKYIKQITDILIAHEANIDQVEKMIAAEGSERFDETLLAAAQTRAEAGAAAAASDKNPVEALKLHLTNYLGKRTRIVDSAHRTKQHFFPFFTSFQNSFDQEQAAILALIAKLNGDNVDLTQHLSVLQAGDLGKTLKSFIKNGEASAIVGQEVKTISAFVELLQQRRTPTCGVAST